MTTRRQFLSTVAALSAASALPRSAFAQTNSQANAVFAPKPGPWRNFQLVTRLEIAASQGRAQAWVPLPSLSESDWIRPAGNEWTTNAGSAEVRRDDRYGAQFLHLEWAQNEKAPVVEVTSRFASRDRAVDLATPGTGQPLSEAERRLYTQGTDLIPVDGIVKQTADRITAGKTTDMDKARAIYEWVVDNTFRNAATRGCGIGDIAAMLKTGNLGGKSADLNARVNALLNSLKVGKGKGTIIATGYQGSSMKRTGGMSIYFPADHINSAYKYLDFNSAEGSWLQFLKKFLS